MRENIISSLKEARMSLDNLLLQRETIDAIEKAGTTLVNALKAGNRVYSCGNGGSMCDAMHFAEELTGRYRLDRKGLPAVAISDPGHLSCVSNDYGYEYVFSRYIESHAGSGDCILAISTSGSSNNIIMAAQTAQDLGMKVIALTGKPNSRLATFSDIEICTPAGVFADRIQELHIKIIHILIELIERAFFPGNYK